MMNKKKMKTVDKKIKIRRRRRTTTILVM